jgi:hypothetical protein
VEVLWERVGTEEGGLSVNQDQGAIPHDSRLHLSGLSLAIDRSSWAREIE